jgi:iron complex transport system ATP-binding protein
MISISRLSVSVNSHRILDKISLDFLPGQFTIIVGPNGAGKTTLLKCIDGGINATSGEVIIDGKPLVSWNNLSLARNRAVLPQHSSLDFPFTVEDVVLMGRIPHTSNDATNRKIIRQCLEQCDCRDLLHRSYTSLSGGEQQRVQTARVFSQIWSEEQDINRYLLLDEPVSALDLNHQYALMRNLNHYAESKNTGIICTLHNLNLAAQFADRTIVLDRGLVVADGPPSEVFTEETLSNVFNLDVTVSLHPENPKIPLIIPKLDETAPIAGQ